ncbi:interferon-inducible GTPase 5-like [Osmerus eperlanus]|uniref:interferon-inducible GTPase 5-like n=1 Tax=Osmerus eperlanus TaxID=29151 RepID=UPI002E13676D
MDAIYDDPCFLDELKSCIMTRPNASAETAKKELDLMNNVTLNIAVTGESGVGKSTLVNALRGVREGEIGSAETGVTETTMMATRYTHPSMTNVFIWDLPGIGTPNFKAKTYLKDVCFETYDFFIIIGTVRFKENDLKLAKEIKKRKKMFYFVRSKIDHDISAEARKQNFNEEKVLNQIRLSCKDNLRTIGNPDVFLISTCQLEKYDFQKLIDSLINNLSDHKRSALVQSMPACSLPMIEQKKRELYKIAFAVAAAAATSAAIAIPGLSVGCEIGVMQGFLKKAHVSFGLDAESIKRIATRINKPERELRIAMTSRFANGINERVVVGMFANRSVITAKAFEVVLSGILGLGSLAAMGISFTTTLHLLQEGIKEMTDDAKAVLAIALSFEK